MKVSLNTVRAELRKINLAIGKDYEVKLEMAQVYWEKMSWVEEHVFVKVCRRWDKEKFPTAMQLLHECREIMKNSEQKSELGGAYRAENFTCGHILYFNRNDLTQNDIQKKLCFLPNIEAVEWVIKSNPNGLKQLENERELSKKDFGEMLCHWHRSIILAKIYPDGCEAQWVESMTNPRDFFKIDSI